MGVGKEAVLGTTKHGRSAYAGEKFKSTDRGLLGVVYVLGLEKVPLVAVEVFEDGDGSVGLLARGLEEFDLAGLHEAIVAPEIVGVEKKEDTPTCLFANALHLIRSGRLREEELWPAGALGSDQKPAFAPGEGGVLDDGEAEGASEEG
jgi:hypothetical protein